MTAIHAISLNELTHSSHNARKSTGKADAELKASIHHHGLLQNLVVCKAKKGFEVVAGGRRLAALQALVEENKLPKDFKVQCNVIESKEASEMSIAENTVRTNMHPADEFVAFAGLVSAGQKTDEIAKRFGVTEKHVKQRLKMGLVHPTIIQAYRDDKIDLDTVQTYTLTDDQAKQLRIFKNGGKNDWSVRRALTDKSLAANDKIAKFVTIAAYEKAGGKHTVDLFGDRIYLDNPSLIMKLANQKMELERERLLKDGYAWVTIMLDGSTYDAINRFERIKAKTKEQKAKCGLIISVGYDGKLEVSDALMKKSDAKKAGAKKSEPSAEAPTFSQALTRDLASYRMEIGRLAVSSSPNVALDVLIMKTIPPLFDEAKRAYGGAAISLTEQNPTPPVREDANYAKKTLESVAEKLALDWVQEGDECKRYIALQKLTLEQKLALLAYAVGATIEAELYDDEAFIEVALASTEFDASRVWRPTAKSFFSRISKPQMLEIGEKLMGKDWSSKNKNLKSAALAELMGQIFADPDKHAKPHAEAIKSWLPDGIQFKMPEMKAAKAKKAA